jgi:hypothetical protein
MPGADGAVLGYVVTIPPEQVQPEQPMEPLQVQLLVTIPPQHPE